MSLYALRPAQLIAFAGYRVLVHFIRQQDTNRTTRKVIRATSTRQRQKSASECLVKNGFFRAFLFRITDDFTQYRRHPYQRANTLFRKLFSGFFFRLQQQYRTRIEVGKIAKRFSSSAVFINWVQHITVMI